MKLNNLKGRIEKSFFGKEKIVDGKKANEKTLITVDDVAQYPLIRSNVTHTLDSNIGSQVGLTTTIIHLSGISTVSSEDVLKINDNLVPNNLTWNSEPPIKPDIYGNYKIPRPGE